MALTLTVTLEPTAERPRVRLDVSGTSSAPVPLVAATSLVTLWRTHSDGRRYKVITEADARLSGGVGVWYDYHAPFGQQVTYSVSVGTAEVPGEPAAGYWNYAPPPNVLPSNLAALGAAGNPAYNGWTALIGAVVASGSWMAVRGTLGLDATIRTARFAVGLAAGAGYDFRFKFKNDSGGNVEPFVLLEFFNAAGAATGAKIVTSGASYAAGSEQAVSSSGSVPAGSVSMSIQISALAAAGPLVMTVKGIMMAASGSSSTIPDAVFMPMVSVAATLDVNDSWLTSATQPDLSVRVDAIVGAGDLQRSSSSAQFKVIGRRNPVDVSSGQRPGYEGTVVVRSDSEEMDQAILACLESDAPVVLNPRPGHERDLPWMWISVRSVSVSNPGDWTDYGYRRLTLTFVEVDQPEVSTNALWTCADVLATYATSSALPTNYATCIDLLTDTRVA